MIEKSSFLLTVYRALRAILYRIPYPLLALLAGLTPALVTLLLVRTELQASLFDFIPNAWNDQTHYWHQIYSFSQVGFDSGYYSFYERTAAIPLFRFSAAGPVYFVFYGILGRLLGWGPYTGILFNMALVALATCLFIRVVRLDRWQILLTALALVATSSVLLYMPSVMQESVHQAAALALAAIFYRLLVKGRDQPRWFSLAALLFLLVMALLRFSWALLLLPFFLLSEKRLTLMRAAWALVKTAALTILVLGIFQSTSAPGNNSIFARLGAFSSSPLEALQDLFKVTGKNIDGSFMRIADVNDLTRDHLQGFQFVLLLGLAAVGALAGQTCRAAGNISRWEMPFHLYNLASILALSLIFYLPAGFYRVFAPHMLITLLLLIAVRRYLPVLVFAAISLLMLNTFLLEYRQQLNTNFHLDHAQIEAMRTTFAQYIIYQPDAENPWCNTILFTVPELNYRVTLVPAGIGVTFFMDPNDLTWPLKSRYVLLDSDTYTEVHDHLHVEKLAVTPLGTIYRNRDADCPG